MAIGLGIALPTQKRENQTLNAEGTLLWLLLVPFISFKLILN